MSRSKVKIPWLGDGFSLYKENISTFYSLLTSILFLNKDISDEKVLKDKAIELMSEIKTILQKRSKNRDEYILEKLKFIKNTKIIIEDNLDKSYFTVNDKNYHILSKEIKSNYYSSSYLYNFPNLVFNYILNRIEIKKINNNINKNVEKIKNNENKSELCQKSKEMIKSRNINYISSNMFIYNILGPFDHDFNIPIDFISDILKLNIIVLENDKIQKIQISNKKHNFVILMKKDSNYYPIYTQEQKMFNSDDKLIKKIIKYHFSDKKPLPEKVNNIKEYVSSLGLEEA